MHQFLAHYAGHIVEVESEHRLDVRQHDFRNQSVRITCSNDVCPCHCNPVSRTVKVSELTILSRSLQCIISEQS